MEPLGMALLWFFVIGPYLDRVDRDRAELQWRRERAAREAEARRAEQRRKAEAERRRRQEREAAAREEERWRSETQQQKTYRSPSRPAPSQSARIESASAESAIECASAESAPVETTPLLLPGTAASSSASSPAAHESDLTRPTLQRPDRPKSVFTRELHPAWALVYFAVVGAFAVTMLHLTDREPRPPAETAPRAATTPPPAPPLSHSARRVLAIAEREAPVLNDPRFAAELPPSPYPTDDQRRLHAATQLALGGYGGRAEWRFTDEELLENYAALGGLMLTSEPFCAGLTTGHASLGPEDLARILAHLDDASIAAFFRRKSRVVAEQLADPAATPPPQNMRHFHTGVRYIRRHLSRADRREFDRILHEGWHTPAEQCFVTRATIHGTEGLRRRARVRFFRALRPD